MDGTPDSLAVWVKFIQGTPQETHPYATISTVITDGTYYQEPCDKEYANILGVARNSKITRARLSSLRSLRMLIPVVAALTAFMWMISS